VRIRFRRYGGLVPKLTQLNCELRVEDLPAEEGAAVRRLVREADLAAAPPAPDPGRAPDAFHYEIDVDDGAPTSAALSAATMTKPQTELVRWLERHAAQRR
jgi:hypothetical protein